MKERILRDCVMRKVEFLRARACHKILKVARYYCGYWSRKNRLPKNICMRRSVNRNFLNSGRSGGETEGMQGKRRKTEDENGEKNGSGFAVS